MSVDILDQNGNVIGRNDPLNGIAEVSNVRKTFTEYCKVRQAILDQEAAVIASQSPYPYDLLHDACTGVQSSYYRVIDSPHLMKPFIFKYKNAKSGVKPLQYYDKDGHHLKYSLARSVMAEETIEIFTRAKRVAYILYDYWFHQRDKISEISFCVRTEIQNLISYIIDKSCTPTYRTMDTTSMVEALRLKLDAEELLASTQ